jgi:hypothetical protein
VGQNVLTRAASISVVTRVFLCALGKAPTKAARLCGHEDAQSDPAREVRPSSDCDVHYGVAAGACGLGRGPVEVGGQRSLNGIRFTRANGK